MLVKAVVPIKYGLSLVMSQTAQTLKMIVKEVVSDLSYFILCFVLLITFLQFTDLQKRKQEEQTSDDSHSNAKLEKNV